MGIKLNARQKKAIEKIIQDNWLINDSYKKAVKGRDSGLAGKYFEFTISMLFNNLKGEFVKSSKQVDLRKKIDGEFKTYEIKQGRSTIGYYDEQGEYKARRSDRYNLNSNMSRDYIIYTLNQYTGNIDEALNSYIIPMGDFIKIINRFDMVTVGETSHGIDARLKVVNPTDKRYNDILTILKRYNTVEEYLYNNNLLQYNI